MEEEKKKVKKAEKPSYSFSSAEADVRRIRLLAAAFAAKTGGCLPTSWAEEKLADSSPKEER